MAKPLVNKVMNNCNKVSIMIIRHGLSAQRRIASLTLLLALRMTIVKNNGREIGDILFYTYLRNYLMKWGFMQ
jgi:hypothetical protein